MPILQMAHTAWSSAVVNFLHVRFLFTPVLTFNNYPFLFLGFCRPAIWRRKRQTLDNREFLTSCHKGPIVTFGPTPVT